MEPLQKRQGNKLKEARKAAGFKKSAASAAAAFGWAVSTYRAHEGGTRTIGQDDAEKYTRAFRLKGSKITVQQVLFPDGKSGLEPAADDPYQRGWDAAMQAVAAAAAAGNIVPPIAAKEAPKPKKKPRKK